MRLMSFALTTDQIRAQVKTVTRRTGWTFLKAGALVQPVVKAMGLKKGERPERIGGPVRIVSVRRAPLNTIDKVDVIKEGFPDLTAAEFVEFFCRTHRCEPHHIVTRIEFEYTEPRG